MMGLADDGGLIVPDSIPDLSSSLEWASDKSYTELAKHVLGHFVDDLKESDLDHIIESSYEDHFPVDIVPLVPIGDIHVMELWHGPTLAFKDLALQFLGNLFECILERDGGELNILGATSGDTGSAAIAGVRGREGMRIFVMHPHGRVSEIQERQMTTVIDRNVFNVAVDGSFDDCQRILKELSCDLEFKSRHSIGAVNSVNWARVIAQVVYYWHAFLRMRKLNGCDAIQVSVPTGNFGDILAGWYARQMGVPISRLILATNENDILTRFFQSGEYRRGDVHRTLSPSMDIQVASNFERYLFELVGRDAPRLSALMQGFEISGSLQVDPVLVHADRGIVAGRADRSRVLSTIQRYYAETNYVLDPHTAVGVAVAEELTNGKDPMVCLATAHPAKFPDAIKLATDGAVTPTHPILEALLRGRSRCARIPARIDAVRNYLECVLSN